VPYPTKSKFHLLQNLKYHLYVMFFRKKTRHASCSGCPYFSVFLYNKARGIQTVLQDKAFSEYKFQSANKLIQFRPKGEIPERLYKVTRSLVEFKLRGKTLWEFVKSKRKFSWVWIKRQALRFCVQESEVQWVSSKRDTDFWVWKNDKFSDYELEERWGQSWLRGKNFRKSRSPDASGKRSAVSKKVLWS
jgi:hypothetical protein